MPRSVIATATSRARISCSTSAPRSRRRTASAKALVGASQGWLSKRFLNGYQRVVPLDAERLRKWEAVHLLHGWAQIVEAHDAGGELADRVPFELIPWIRERFESALA